MNAQADSELNLSRPPSLLRACAIFAAVLAAALPLFIAVGLVQSGGRGLLAALLACGVCFAAGTLALAITAISQKVNQGVQGILGAMLVRMSVPLGALLLLPKAGGPLEGTSIAGMVLGYYLIALVAETWLSLRFVPVAQNHGTKSSAAKVA